MKRTVIYLLLLVPLLNSCNETKAEKANSIINQSTTSKTMKDENFTTAIVVDQSPKEVFDAVTNVRGWWSEEIEGGTARLNDEFTYHYKDVHFCKARLTEVIPGKKVVWHILDNYFNFIQDQKEWKNTNVVFDITEKDGKTHLRLTHIGLLPTDECYTICHDAWTNYIQNSLKDLITTGKGTPNTKENDFNRQLLEDWKSKQVADKDYTKSYLIEKSPAEVFNAINNITQWWSEDFKGTSKKLNDEFEVWFFKDLHYSKQKLVEVVPNKKVVWLITDSKLTFLKDKNEWTGTKVSFELTEKDGKTELLFTHYGLKPEIECYNDCTKGWTFYIEESLLPLINTGKGEPTPIS